MDAKRFFVSFKELPLWYWLMLLFWFFTFYQFYSYASEFMVTFNRALPAAFMIVPIVSILLIWVFIARVIIHCQQYFPVKFLWWGVAFLLLSFLNIIGLAAWFIALNIRISQSKKQQTGQTQTEQAPQQTVV